VSAADVVHAALELLEALPDRPHRLRVRAADVTVDLDWRIPAVPVAVPAPDGGQHLVSPGAEEPTYDGTPEDPAADEHHVCSPSVGTFYRAPEPGGTPFVEVGDSVAPGQQVGIVEAMKLMLPIEADLAGRVGQILVDDGRPVEFGQRIMTIEPSE
jgi:acetyl-CoA carboxylase biotin carboxyl carrier protein